MLRELEDREIWGEEPRLWPPGPSREMDLGGVFCVAE